MSKTVDKASNLEVKNDILQNNYIKINNKKSINIDININPYPFHSLEIIRKNKCSLFNYDMYEVITANFEKKKTIKLFWRNRDINARDHFGKWLLEKIG